MYEIGRAGASGFSSEAGFSFSDLGGNELQSQFSSLTSSGMEWEAADYCISAVGLAMSCLGCATGLVSEIRAAITASNAVALKKTYGVAQFSSATSGVTGIRELLNRYAAELAAMGAMDMDSVPFKPEPL